MNPDEQTASEIAAELTALPQPGKARTAAQLQMLRVLRRFTHARDDWYTEVERVAKCPPKNVSRVFLWAVGEAEDVEHIDATAHTVRWHLATQHEQMPAALIVYEAALHALANKGLLTRTERTARRSLRFKYSSTETGRKYRRVPNHEKYCGKRDSVDAQIAAVLHTLHEDGMIERSGGAQYRRSCGTTKELQWKALP